LWNGVLSRNGRDSDFRISFEGPVPLKTFFPIKQSLSEPWTRTGPLTLSGRLERRSQIQGLGAAFASHGSVTDQVFVLAPPWRFESQGPLNRILVRSGCWADTEHSGEWQIELHLRKESHMTVSLTFWFTRSADLSLSHELRTPNAVHPVYFNAFTDRRIGVLPAKAKKLPYSSIN
jgi:hypothetical protein